MPPASKKGVKRRVQLFTKVSRLKGLLRASNGETLEVEERQLSSLDLLKDIQSVADLPFARKTRSALWLCNDAFLYKSSRSSCLDLEVYRTYGYQGVCLYIKMRQTAGGKVQDIYLLWKEANRSSRAVMESTDRIFGVLARDSRIASICSARAGSARPSSLPLSPEALRYFFSEAASPRTVSFIETSFTREQCPMLFSSKEGSVAIRGLDVSVLHDDGVSLLEAVKGNFGLRQLHLLHPDRVSETFFCSLMTCLSTNQMIHTLKIGDHSSHSRFEVADTQARMLAQVLRVNTSITNFQCQLCRFSNEGWNLLWNAIKVNCRLVEVNTNDSFSSSARSLRDDPIVDALRLNSSVVTYQFMPGCHSRNFSARIEPFLQRNRAQKLSRDISAESCQSKRWRILGQSLRTAKARGSGPDILYAFLRNNVDDWVSCAPTGREVVQRQLQKVDAQRAALLAKLRQYDDPPLEGSPATRKRQSSEGVHGEGPGGSRAKLDP